jgi:hypothetical protein
MVSPIADAFIHAKSQLNLLRISGHGAAAVLRAKVLFRRLGVLFDILTLRFLLPPSNPQRSFKYHQYSGALPLNAIAMRLYRVPAVASVQRHGCSNLPFAIPTSMYRSKVSNLLRLVLFLASVLDSFIPPGTGIDPVQASRTRNCLTIVSEGMLGWSYQ